MRDINDENTQLGAAAWQVFSEEFGSSTRDLTVKFLKRIKAYVAEEGASSPKFLAFNPSLIPRQDTENRGQNVAPL